MALQNTRKSAVEMERELRGAKHLFFIGIGGVHMSSLALFLKARGFEVSGSDRTAGEGTERLVRAGVKVYIGHDEKNLGAADAVIYTLAISPDNPEYRAARERGLPLCSRADYLGYLMAAYPTRIGVSGAHGKSTVTAMLGDIFALGGRSPTVFCGAVMPISGTPLLIGEGKDFIFEACEYGDSFLSFSPTLSVVLNGAHDHTDYFPTLDDVCASFQKFAALPGKGGMVLYGGEDANATLCVIESPAARYSFGAGGDYEAHRVGRKNGCACFTFSAFGEELGEIALRVPGRHNLQNALAAAGAAHLCGIAPAVILRALSDFRGASRRMEYRGTLNGARLFDDYAHHPDEIAATLTAAREMAGTGRLFAVFQSHTYTRTKAFLSEIALALSLADRVLIADIYAARERDPLGMSAAVLAAAVGARATPDGTFDAIAATLAHELRAGDVCVVMGAGDIDRLFARFSKKDFTL